jgi:hypothetical protein
MSLGLLTLRVMEATSRMAGGNMVEQGTSNTNILRWGASTMAESVRIEGNQGPKGWEMEVYRGDHVRKKEVHQMDADILEFDLDEEDSIHMLKALTIDVFHSQKSYNPQFLFSNMLKAWGLQKLASVEKIGDYIFKIEFGTEEEKARVLEWGPWRHKSDTLIVVHYDGLMRPLEIKIQTLGLWVRFYDLPPAMLKEGVAKQLGGGGQLGKFIRMDCRYPGYEDQGGVSIGKSPTTSNDSQNKRERANAYHILL